MMSFEEKIEYIKTNFLPKTEFFTKEELFKLSDHLRPEYEFDIQDIDDIFNTKALNQLKTISRDEVARMLDAIREIMSTSMLKSQYIQKGSIQRQSTCAYQSLNSDLVNFQTQEDQDERSDSESKSLVILGSSSRSTSSTKDSNDNEENQVDFQTMEQDLNEMLERINLVQDEVRNNEVAAKAVMKVADAFKQFINKSKKYSLENKELKEKLADAIKFEEDARIRASNLEFDLKQYKDFLSNLQNEYELLCSTMEAQKAKLSYFAHLEASLTEKNNEMVRLERKVREIEDEKNQALEKLKNLENETQILAQDYKEIQTLLQKTNNEIDELKEGQVQKVSGTPKHLKEIGSLEGKFRALLAKNQDFEKEKEGFRQIISELKEELFNTKEFNDTLKLEKKDLQAKADKLEKELDALRSEDTGKASIIMGMSKSFLRKGVDSRNQNSQDTQAVLRKIHEAEEERSGHDISMTSSVVINQSKDNSLLVSQTRNMPHTGLGLIRRTSIEPSIHSEEARDGGNPRGTLGKICETGEEKLKEISMESSAVFNPPRKSPVNKLNAEPLTPIFKDIPAKEKVYEKVEREEEKSLEGPTSLNSSRASLEQNIEKEMDGFEQEDEQNKNQNVTARPSHFNAQ